MILIFDQSITQAPGINLRRLYKGITPILVAPIILIVLLFQVRQPRVSDQGSGGEKIRFSPSILSPYATR